jgi:cytoplasmic FMR1 interacting protein
LGDSVAWGGCTIIYLLGQQMHFELFDFSYQVLNIAEVEAGLLSQAHKNPHAAQVLKFTSIFEIVCVHE